MHAGLTFTDLKRMLGLTDGNLSMHARRLLEVGYLEARKTPRGRSTHTLYVLTPAGRRALSRYLDHLEAIVRTLRPLMSESR
jgi:DNA-binding MarR family transcriptional regulator